METDNKNIQMTSPEQPKTKTSWREEEAATHIDSKNSSQASGNTPDEISAAAEYEGGEFEEEEEMSNESISSTSKPKEGLDIAKAEDKAVFYARLLVLFVLAGAALLVSFSVRNYLANEEQRQFQEQFDSDATKLLDSIAGTLENTLGPVDSMIVNLLSYAHGTANTTNPRGFPFITLPYWGLQFSKMLRYTKAVRSDMKYVVLEDQAEEWAEYANSLQYEIQRALDIMEGDPDWKGPINRNYTRCNHIMGYGHKPLTEPTDYARNYIPQWQKFPVIANPGACPYNFDAWQSPDVANAILHMMDTQHAVIGNFPGVNFDSNDPSQAQAKARLERFVESVAPPGFDKTEPLTQMLFPIFDTVDSVYVDISQPQDFLGYVSITVFFRSLIEGLLPPNSNGILIVVEQLECGHPFTYRLDGADATFLGVGDIHDSKYNNMVHAQIWQEMADPVKSRRKTSYSGVPISTKFCPNLIKIYPSEDRENYHKSSNPTIMALVAGSIFAFTSIVFLVFDFLVQRRQKTVMKRAIESGAIVSSLFPKDVVEKLYKERSEKNELEQKAMKFKVLKEGPLPKETPSETTQIAKLYKETTVFFGDLSGFTAWSSSRPPSEVFLLLEALYGAFDLIAKKRRVFKVETIGDCYLAITGCPEPQPNHALIMVYFARDCFAKMNTLLADLVETLGDDTADLNFRIGLNSGPVTAGVLRGEKARFQLFGDTVNTCARVETTGIKGRIHVSKSTADELVKLGKKSWLTPREDRVIAKGKGEMVTYWVTPRTGSASVDTSLSQPRSFSNNGNANEEDHHITNDNNNNVNGDNDKMGLVADILGSSLRQRV